MQECEFWPTQLSDDSSTFKKLLMTEDLFGAENKTIRSPKFIKLSKGRKRQQSSDTKRIAYAEMFSSHVKPVLQ